MKQAAATSGCTAKSGRGTTFKVYLPRIERAPRGAAAAAERATPRRRTETILLVEDEEPLRAIAREILDEHGYHVLEARAPARRIELVRPSTPAPSTCSSPTS